jgi:hypothetical protein
MTRPVGRFDPNSPRQRAGLCLIFSGAAVLGWALLTLFGLLSIEPFEMMQDWPEEAGPRPDPQVVHAALAVVTSLFVGLGAGFIASGIGTWRGARAAMWAGVGFTGVLALACGVMVVVGLLATVTAGLAGLLLAGLVGGPLAVMGWQGLLLKKALAQVGPARGEVPMLPRVWQPARADELPPPVGSYDRAG